MRIVVEPQKLALIPAELIKVSLVFNMVDEEFNQYTLLTLPNYTVDHVAEVIGQGITGNQYA